MKHDIKFRRFMSAGLSTALALSLALPSFALEGKEVKGKPTVGGNSEVTVQVLCDHGHTHWEDNGDGTHDEICNDCGDVVTDDEPHSDDDGNGVCDKCGENSHQVLVASIPVVLPIMAKVDGSVTVPSNAEITNLTEGRAIRVKDLEVTLSGGWSLVDGNTSFTEADKGSKLLAMGFRGTPVKADGSMDMTRSDWSIAIDGSLPLEMRAAIPAQTQKSAESSIGKVTFTLDWAEESTEPELPLPDEEPEPDPSEMQPTTIDRAKMAEVFGGRLGSYSTEDSKVKTIRFVYGNPVDGTDISNAQNRTVLAKMDDELNGIIYMNKSYLTDAFRLFDGYSSITSMNLEKLNTSNIAQMGFMFSGCSGLTTLDVSNFDTRNVTQMFAMFQSCGLLTSLDVSNFDTSNVTDMGWMFSRCSSLTSLDVSGFDTGNVMGMRCMFAICPSLTTLDVSGFDTGNVTNMDGMFSNCKALTTLDVSGFDTRNVTEMGHMFNACYALASLDVSSFDTHNVTRMCGMFSSCESLTPLDVSNWDTSNVTDMGEMFTQCYSLTSLDVSGWDTSSVTNMRYMFFNCTALTSLDVSGWGTGNVTDTSHMFDQCYALAFLDVSGFDTRNVTDMSDMFRVCFTLDSLDLSNWDTGNVTDMSCMLDGCGVQVLHVKDEATKAKIATDANVSPYCTIIVGSPA